MNFVVKTASLPNGIKLPYLERGISGGVPLLFVHGYGGSWMDFELLLSELPDWLWAIAVTLRGHADATIADGGYRPVELASDLALFIETLGFQSVIIIGASSGGIVSRHVALDYPDRVTALGFISSPATLRGKTTVIDLWDSTVSKLTDPLVPQFARDFNQNLVDKEISQEFMEAVISQSQGIPAKVWKDTLTGLLADDSLSRLHKIRVPCLLISGDKDAVLPVEDIELLKRTIVDLRTVVIPGAGHGLMWEDPQWVATGLVEFVELIGLSGVAREN